MILGGGLSGTLLQRALPAGYTVLVNAPRGEDEPSNTTSTTSTTTTTASTAVTPPVALAHQYPGRTLKHDPFRAHVLRTSMPALAELAAMFPDLVAELQVLRPLDGPAGKRLLKSFQSGDSDDTHVDLVTLLGAMEQYPELQISSSAGEKDGVLLKAGLGYSVQMDKLVSELQRDSLLQAAECVVPGTASVIRQHVDGTGEDERCWWTAEDSSGAELAAGEHVVLALGAELASWFPHSPAVVERGHLLQLPHQNPIQALISRGDVHYAPSPAGAVVGSTRWLEPTPPDLLPRAANDNDSNGCGGGGGAECSSGANRGGGGGGSMSREEGCAILLQRAQSLFNPGTALLTASYDDVWEGRRCSMPDRRPLVGPVPLALLGTGFGDGGEGGGASATVAVDGAAACKEEAFSSQTVHVLGGFGGLGMITAPWAAAALANHLLACDGSAGSNGMSVDAHAACSTAALRPEALPARFTEPRAWFSKRIILAGS